ncbi:MAG: polyribonucleotide nucleotidyltransferase [Candidatus Nealsonbacteria bacterium CG02_land_8_20_14_3_00_37_10]|uniref:Polyribonucleotide nucleotidyltransferase n=1 Tax=Candidatus Nealsonbacteria bacterium CG02_land_8_20_14_3_00_37_10 TaxID=1974699 RepID=A0A2M7D9W6_9BACT|nr:MAG: polyribonucleotide nucleotidyltransferase [Candidatus Nealsonbacteria bacterium CG02_land_8_20_14_3_00_37_10]
MNREVFKLNIGGKELKVEFRNLAEQASGDVLVQYGETMVLATAVMSNYEREEIDFFPLTVDYEERYYAAGRILGSRYIRRESRPSDEAILTSRFIDRAIRPRFPKHLKREVQVVVTCLSWDRENDPDIIGCLAASLALSVSNIPWSGPIAVLRVGKNGEDFILNPTYQEREKNDLDLAIAGLESRLAKIAAGEGDDKILINMIEMEGNEVEEDTVLKAMDFAKPILEKLCDFQEEIVMKVGKEKIKIEESPKDLELEKEIKDFLGDRLEKTLYQENKASRMGKENKFSSSSSFPRSGNSMDEVNALKEELIYYIQGKYPAKRGGEDLSSSSSSATARVFEEEMERLVHENIIKRDKRPDARKIDEIRNIQCEVGLLPRTHGSGLFIRGQTKALSILTLGAPGDVRLLEGMETIGKKRFMHHYNFPPYCSGEVKPMRGPGRREIGHGMLAEKALMSLVPSFDDFPYTIRIVTEILSSNGSTSMAAVSAASLALMDAGVPIKRPATGIALGLMQDNNGNYKILTDIQGPEDHHGDMDFKIAGTEKGITAIQMDVKVAGVGKEIIEKALRQGKKARLQILNEMAKVISKPRPELSPHAPRILTLQINPVKIREVIGPGGKVINEIIEECGVSIDIEDSGRIFVTAEKEEAARKAVEWIKNITREVKVDEIFQGKVKRILDFGAFVEILPGQEGLVHISQLATYRVNKVEDIVKVGDIIPVKVISIDEQGRINLSLKEAKR